MKIVFLLLLISFSAIAQNYSAEKAAIDKFEKDEFLSEKNYPPTKPGQLKKLNKAFADKLQAEPTSLKYFLFLAQAYRMIDKYKVDRAFALSIESKFGGKKMTTAQWDKVWDLLSANIFKDSNAEHIKAMANPQGADAYFEKNLAIIKATTFK